VEVEFTARQVRITKALRAQAEEGLERIARLLGKTARASVTFGVQRHLQIAEVTVQSRLHMIAAAGQAETLESALREALERAENQARRHRDRKIEGKRLPKDEKSAAAPPVTRSKARAVDGEAGETETAPPRAGTRAKKAVVQAHIVKSSEAIASAPLTLEEAVKETESRDRDLLVFRDKGGELFVLHRKRDGQMELVEIP
jgi:putative sigma-54 modulation protein